VTGETRKTQLSQSPNFLEVEFEKGDLNSKEVRQKVADVFTREIEQNFDVDRIHTWVRNRNHKSKKRGGGGGGGVPGGRVVLKVRDTSNLSDGEIVLVTSRIPTYYHTKYDNTDYVPEM
jgi:hypothetical protein